MASFDILKTFFEIDQKHPRANIYNFIMGGVAGTIAVCITYPSDLIRRKMQLSGMPGHPSYKGFYDCGVTLLREEGVIGWYRGLWACILKVAPAMAVMFWCNELLKNFI
jgi:solute carrier family 25 (mitochondrial phosphate transporter), member 23/24/25/41